MQESPFWASHVHADRRPALLARAAIVRALRAWFAAQDFVEVETPALQVSPGNEAHLHAFATELASPRGHAPRYLRTSPEFTCKKLLAAGEERIVEFARVFRNRERGALHHPEFTLIEWYRAGKGYEALMDDCMALFARAAEAAGSTLFRFRERTADPRATPERLSVVEAFMQHAGIDLLATLPAAGPDVARFAAAAGAAKVRVAADDSWEDIFSRVLVERIEPQLGRGRVTILRDYPAVMSALARPLRSDPRLAERFELYVCGVELANGCGELNDAAEQRARLEAQMSIKQRVYGERYPVDEDFLTALSHMPDASGVALGLDRLVMLATGASRIEQVMWVPVADI